MEVKLIRNLKNKLKKLVTILLMISLMVQMVGSYPIVRYAKGFDDPAEAVDDLIVTSNLTLSEDMTVRNLTVSSNTLNLNGYKLRVKESAAITGNGSLLLGKGYLYCYKNLNVTTTNTVTMNNANDYILVEGDVTWQPSYRSALSAGCMEIKGDFTQKKGSSYSDNFAPSGTHTTILSGDTKQTVRFGENSSFFNILKLRNTSEEGICSDGVLHAAEVIRNSTNLSYGFEGTYGWTLSEDEVIAGDLCLLEDVLELNGNQLTIKGDLIQAGGVIHVNGGSLVVEGDYRIQGKRIVNGNEVYDKSNGKLVMTNQEDRVVVGKDFVMGSLHSHLNKLTDGVLEVKKNITQETYSCKDNFCSTNAHTLLLSGDDLQTIRFADSGSAASRIANLEIKNESSEGVAIHNTAALSGTVNDHQHHVTGTLLFLSGATAAGGRFSGSVRIETTTATSQELHIGGDFTTTAAVTLGNDLYVKGNVRADRGSINLNGHLAEADGNIAIRGAYIRPEKGTLVGKGNVTMEYYTTPTSNYASYLYMDQAGDRVLIYGDFYTDSDLSGTMSNGLLEIKGDFTQNSTRANFVASGSHKTVLSGDRLQTVTFGSSQSRFNIVELQNYSAQGIYAENGINAVTLIRNGCRLTTGTEGEYGWTLQDDEVYDGDLYLLEDQLDLNGHKLTIKGNLIQAAGTVAVNGGCLKVEGNYRMQSAAQSGGTVTYGKSNGRLVMTNEEDQVIVNGDFVMGSILSHAGKLTNGVMEVNGNVTQITYSAADNFCSTNGHKLLLGGDRLQTIAFANSSASASRIAHLELKNKSNDGVILTNKVAVTGTVNDGSRLGIADKYGKVSGTVLLVPGASVTDSSFSGSIRIESATATSQELWIGGDIIVAGNVTLGDDFYVKGNVSVESYYWNLNGHSATVEGNVTIRGSDIRPDGGSLICKRDLTLDGTSGSAASYLYMAHADDYVVVYGTMYANSRANGTMNAGVLELKGDFRHTVTSAGNSFVASGTHKTIFSGDGLQTVTFGSPQSYFNIVELKNYSIEGVYAEQGLHALTLIRNGCHLAMAAEGEFGRTLEHDEVYDGDFYMLDDELNLSGHSLTIKGNLIQAGGVVAVNGGTLRIEGDYRIQSAVKSNGTRTYGMSSGTLVMKNETDRVFVNGSFVMGSIFSHAGRLENGILEVKNDVTQVVYAANDTYASTKEHTLLLSGDGLQTVRFVNSSAVGSRVAHLKISNHSEEGVTITSPLAVTGTVNDGSTKSPEMGAGNSGGSTPGGFDGVEFSSSVTGAILLVPGAEIVNGCYAGSVRIEGTMTTVQELHIGGDVTVAANVTLGNDLFVKGSLWIASGFLAISGHSTIVEENTSIRGGYIRPESGSLICKGDLTLENVSSGSAASYLYMAHADDHVVVYGTMYVNSRSNGTMNAGILELKKDFRHTVTGSANSFAASGTHKTVLSGDQLQTITFGSPQSYFHILELRNHSTQGIFMDSDSIHANEIIRNGCQFRVGDNGTFGWKLMEDTVIGEDIYIIADDLDLNGHMLIVNGNLFVGLGSIKINGGHLVVNGDFRYQTVTKNEGQISYGNSKGFLVMTNESDHVTVKGSFVMQSSQSHTGKLTAGIMEIQQDFTQNNALSTNFAPSGTHTVLLSGKGSQSVRFANPSASNSYFNQLHVTNTANAGVSFDTNVYIKGNVSDSGKKVTGTGICYVASIDDLKDSVFGGNMACLTNTVLTRDLTIKGTLTSSYSFDVNGQNLFVGHLNITAAMFIVNGGQVRVAGDLSVTGNSASYFAMTNENDNVVVAGNFSTSSAANHTGKLTAGTLEINGDFTQTGNYYNFAASGSHKTILSGKPETGGRKYVQTISFANISYSKFYTLVLTKSPANYHFTIDVNAVCHELIYDRQEKEPPLPVEGLNVTEETETNIKLQWNPSPESDDVLGYEIYRGNVKIGATSMPFFTDTGLQPNQAYVYTVYAFDALKNRSPVSSQVTGTTWPDTHAPDIPSGVKIRTRTGSCITIEWNPSADNVKTTGYEVYRDGALLGTVSKTSYQDADVTPNVMHRYQIKAFDAAGNTSDVSSEVKGSTAMPSMISLSPENHSLIGGESVTLTLVYQDHGNSIGNKVKFEYSADGERWESINYVLLGQQVQSAGRLYSSCSWNLKSIPSGTYRVRATLYDYDGNAATKEVDYYKNTEAPKAPEEVNAESDYGIVQVSWLPSVSAYCEKYHLYRAEGGAFTKLKTIDGRSHVTYEDKNVIIGNTYQYKVTAVDRFGVESSDSETASVTVGVDTISPDVTSISPSKKRIHQTAQITVYATDNIRVDSITLQYRSVNRSDRGDWNDIGRNVKANKEGSAVFHWDTLALEDGDYTVCAVAYDTSGNASINEFTTTLTIDNTGIAKIILNETSASSDYVMLKWNRAEENDFGYVAVEQLIDGQFAQVEKITNTLGAYIKNLKEESVYTFRVVGYDDLGNRGIPSDEVTLYTKPDLDPPRITNIRPAMKYYNKTIPLNISVTDNHALDSLEIKYSFDQENWIGETILKAEQGIKTCTFSYDFDVTRFDDGDISIQFTAYDTAGNVSTYHNKPIVDTFTILKTPPEKITDLTAENKVGYVALNWTIPQETIGSFRIYRAEESSGNYTIIKDHAAIRNYYDKTAAYGVTYSYKIAAIDFAGTIGPSSNEVIARCEKDTQPPNICGVSPVHQAKAGMDQTITAAVIDNVLVDHVTFEYKQKKSEEDIWTRMDTIEVNRISEYVDTVWHNQGLEDGDYLIRITAVDLEGNVSKPYEVTYAVKTTVPKQLQPEAAGKGYRVELSWPADTEDDFDHYEIYKKGEQDTDFCLLKQTKAAEYMDKAVTPDAPYEYKIVAYDTFGNRNSSPVVRAVPTDEDEEAPVCILAKNITARAGSEFSFDASSCTDNVGIVDYFWDFGDGHTTKGFSGIHTYDQEGDYTITLEAIDGAGNQSHTTQAVSVLASKVPRITVQVRDLSGRAIGDAYIYIESAGKGTNEMSDAYGNLVTYGDSGNYTISAYRQGYLPKEKKITVKPGENKEVTINLEEKPLITGGLTVRPLEPHELEELGVDMKDPINWYVQTKEILTYYDEYPLGSYGVKGGKPGGIEEEKVEPDLGNVTFVVINGKRFIVTTRVDEVLKDMFEVELHIVNEAEPEFSLTGGEASLYLPLGLSLLDTNRTQSCTVNVPDIKGQSSQYLYWYIKADESGTYNVSADYNGILMPFNAPVAATFEAEPFVVDYDKKIQGEKGGGGGGGAVGKLRVKDHNGNPVEGAAVNVVNKEVTISETTDSNGIVWMEDMPDNVENLFTLSVTKDGYYESADEDFEFETAQLSEVTIFPKVWDGEL